MTPQKLLLLSNGLKDYGGMKFDGATNYLDGNALTGIADSKVGTFVAIVRFANASGTAEKLFGPDGAAFSVLREADGNIQILARNAATTVIMNYNATAAPCTAAGTYVILASWDLATPGSARLYVNEVQGVNSTTYTDDTIDYTRTEWGIGASVTGATPLNGDLYLLWFDPTQRLEFNTDSVRRKFTEASGIPRYLGQSGERPTGTAPGVFHAYDPAVSWATNRGTFNATTWTKNGTFADPTVMLRGRAH